MNLASKFGNPFTRGAAIVLALAVGIFAVSHFSHAASVSSGATPLQFGQTGVWYDPNHSGEGVELFVNRNSDANNGGFVTIFAGKVDGSATPLWFTANVPGYVFDTGEVPVWLSDHTFNGPPSGGDLLTVGTLRLRSLDCSTIVADISLDEPFAAQSAQWVLKPLVQPLAGNCASCDGMSPPMAGCSE